MKKYKLYTHIDLDGAGCAVLANIAFDRNVDIEYVRNPNECTESLVKMGNEYKEYEYIYVTDCSFNPQEVAEKNPKVLNHIKLFDHHKTAIEGFKEYHWATVEPMLYGRPTCGTELFYEHLKLKGLITDRTFFVEQVRLLDTWEWTKYPSKIPKYLSDLVFDLGLQYFVRAFTDRIAGKDLNELNLFNEFERTILMHETIREEKEIKRFMECAYYGTVENNGTQYKFSIVFNDSKYTSVLGNKICKELGVDIAFMINLNRDKIEVRTARTDINLGEVMKKYYNGGGHPQASGGSIEGVSVATAKEILGRFGNVTEIAKQTN